MRTLLLLLVVAAYASSQDGGSIEGVVVNAVTGAAVKRAVVTITPDGLPRPPVSVATDAEGRFEASSLAEGSYRVVAKHPAFPARGLAAAGSASLVAAANGERARVTLKLTPGGGVSGRVVDPEGEPVPYCSVQVFALREGDLVSTGGSVTDDRGRYRIGEVPAGRYYVQAWRRTGLPAPRPLMALQSAPEMETWPGVFYPNSADATGASTVMVRAGVETDGIDFKLHRVAVVRVRGQATGVDAAPTQTWQFELKPAGPSARSSSIEARANRNHFEFAAVPPGSYVLSGHAVSGDRRYWGRLTLEVGPAGVDDVVLPMAAGVDMQVRVRVEGEGGVRAQPVQLYPSPAHAGVEASNASLDDDSILRNVLPLRYHTYVIAAGGPHYIKSISLAGQSMTPPFLEVPAGASGPLDIVLGTKMSSVSGIVDGPPGSLVLLHNNLAGFTAVAGAGGAWRLDVAPGKYRVVAIAGLPPEAAASPDVYDLVRSRGQAITVDEGAALTLPLKALDPAALH